MSSFQTVSSTGGGVNLNQTVSLSKKCQDLVINSGCISKIREEVLIPILEYLAYEAPKKMTLNDNPIQVLWIILRQGSFMCELLNQVQPGVIQFVTLPIPPIGETNFTDSNSKQNVATFIKASKDMFFKQDEELFNPGDLYKEDFNAFSKAIALCEFYFNKSKIRLSSRVNSRLDDQNLDEEVMKLFDVRPVSLSEIVEETEENPSDEVLVVGSSVKRQNILDEMIASERVYVEDLAKLYKYKEMVKFDRVITQKDLDLIFSNLKSLLNFQRKFMIEMETQISKDSPDFKSLFESNESEFVVYEEFCLNHGTALRVLNENKAKLDAKRDLLFEIGEVEKYLIKPVQRITRYSLFMRDLVKDAQKHSILGESENFMMAGESIKRVALRINERQRAAENQKIAQEFFAHFTTKIVNPEKAGKLVLYEKSMRLKFEGELKIYRVYLFERKLIMCGEKEVSGPFWLKNKIPIDSVREVVERPPSEDASFQFEIQITCITLDREVSFSMFFTTEQPRKLWSKNLRELAGLKPLIEIPGPVAVSVPIIDNESKDAPRIIENIKMSTERVNKPLAAAKSVSVVYTVKFEYKEERYCLLFDSIPDLKDLIIKMREEILEIFNQNNRKTNNIPDVERIRLKYRDEGDRLLYWLTNHTILEHELNTKNSIYLKVVETLPIRIRVTFRDVLYTFEVDEIDSIEELRIYISETISEDYRLLNANMDAIPSRESMRIFYRESDDQWSVLLYDNDLESILKLSDKSFIDLKI